MPSIIGIFSDFRKMVSAGKNGPNTETIFGKTRNSTQFHAAVTKTGFQYRCVAHDIVHGSINRIIFYLVDRYLCL